MLEKVKTPPWPPRMWSTANLRTIAVQQGSEGFSDFLVGANGPGPAMFETSNLTLPVEPGEARIRVLVPIPVPTATIVWFLDEFSLLGGLEGFDVVARKLAERTGATFVLVDGTSVARSHPGLLRLVDGVLDWLTKQSSEASWRDRMVVLGGIGTGALVAASAAIVARDRQAEIGLQVLVSPALFPRSAASGDGPAEEPNDLLTEEMIGSFWSSYSDLPGEGAAEGLPSTAGLEDVAPAVILAAGADLLRSDGPRYAERLEAAGVAVEHREYPGEAHDFVSLLMMRASEPAFQQIVRAVRSTVVRAGSGR